jgi:hypothetical protein
MYSISTLRRRAYEIGYQVKKGFQHYGMYVYHDQYGDRYPGYMVIDLQTGFPVWGSYDSNFDFLWSIEDVDDFLKEQYEAQGLAW